MSSRTLRRRLYHGDVDGKRQEHLETSGLDSLSEPLLADDDYIENKKVRNCMLNGGRLSSFFKWFYILWCYVSMSCHTDMYSWRSMGWWEEEGAVSLDIHILKPHCAMGTVVRYVMLFWFTSHTIKLDSMSSWVVGCFTDVSIQQCLTVYSSWVRSLTAAKLMMLYLFFHIRKLSSLCSSLCWLACFFLTFSDKALHLILNMSLVIIVHTFCAIICRHVFHCC